MSTCPIGVAGTTISLCTGKSRRAGGSRYGRVEGPAYEPSPGGQRDEGEPIVGRPSRESPRAGVRRRGASRQDSGTGPYGSEIGSNTSRAAVAELVGTSVLVYAGTTVAVLATLGVPVIGTAFDSLAVPLAFGLTLTALVAALGHVSGAHLNPVVTLGLAATRKFPWVHVPVYLLAQLLGAILGSIATWITVGVGVRSDAALASPGLAPGSCRGSSWRRSSPLSWSSSSSRSPQTTGSPAGWPR